MALTTSDCVLRRGGPLLTPQHGVSSNQLALITSDCDAMRLREHQMALVTSDCAPSRRPARRRGRDSLRGPAGGATASNDANQPQVLHTSTCICADKTCLMLGRHEGAGRQPRRRPGRQRLVLHGPAVHLGALEAAVVVAIWRTCFPRVWAIGGLFGEVVGDLDGL